MIAMNGARKRQCSFEKWRKREEKMANEDVKTVTIPLDEYFELRQKAEANLFLMTELGRFQSMIDDVHRRICEHEREWHGNK